MIPKIMIIMAALFLLSNCISLIPEPGPGPDIYRLSAINENGNKASKKQVVLLPLVKAPKELKNNRVALVQGPQTISYAANARWAASTPEMLQAFFASSLREQGSIQVVFPTDGLEAQTEILIRLQNFEADYDQGTKSAPLAIVAFRAQLIDRKTRLLIDEKKFRKTKRAEDIRLGSIVSAIDQATHDAALQMTNWVGSLEKN